MPSKALHYWLTRTKTELDEFENAHTKIGGTGPGRRYLTRQINHAYVVAVSAQFQRFCRDLHTEAAQRLVAAASPDGIRSVLSRLLTENRKLDTGNASSATIGPDFNRMGLSFFAEIDAAAARNRVRRSHLDQLNVWRNAIVHQNFKLKPEKEALVHGTSPDRVLHVRRWRQNCSELAEQFDRVVRTHVSRVVGGPPWE